MDNTENSKGRKKAIKKLKKALKKSEAEVKHRVQCNLNNPREEVRMELSLSPSESDDCEASSSSSSYNGSEMEVSPLCERLVNSVVDSEDTECDNGIQNDKSCEDRNSQTDFQNLDFHKKDNEEKEDKSNDTGNDSEDEGVEDVTGEEYVKDKNKVKGDSDEEVQGANARKRMKL